MELTSGPPVVLLTITWPVTAQPGVPGGGPRGDARATEAAGWVRERTFDIRTGRAVRSSRRAATVSRCTSSPGPKPRDTSTADAISEDHASQAVSRRASSSTSRRAARGNGSNGDTTTREATCLHVPATCPSTRKLGDEWGVLVSYILVGTVSAGSVSGARGPVAWRPTSGGTGRGRGGRLLKSGNLGRFLRSSRPRSSRNRRNGIRSSAGASVVAEEPGPARDVLARCGTESAEVAPGMSSSSPWLSVASGALVSQSSATA